MPGGSWDQDAGGAWLPDDTIVFTTGGSPLMRVPAAGGDPVRHLTADAAGELHFHSAHALPGARGLLYVVHRESGPDTLEVFAGGKRKVLLHAPGQGIHDPVYSATGHILFGRTPVNEGVWALPFSLERLDATGAPYLVEAGLGTPSVSTTGTFLYLPAPTTVPTRLQWLARDGTPLEAIGEAAQFETFPELSPDGTQVAISERVSGTWGLSVIDLARGTRVRLAAGERVSTPAWAPDGRSILYSSTPPGAVDPVIQRVWLDGSPSETLESGLRPVSRDGLRYFFERLRNNDFDLLVGTLDRTAPTGIFVGGRARRCGCPAVARWPARGVHVDAVDHRGESRGRVEALPGHRRAMAGLVGRWIMAALEPRGRPRLLQHRGRYLRGDSNDEWRHIDAVAAASPLRA